MLYFIYRPSNQPGIQRSAGAELRARIVQKFKEATRQYEELENSIEPFKLFLDAEVQSCEEEADRLDNLN